MKLLFTVAFLTMLKTGTAQTADTNSIRRLIYHALSLYPDKTDSILYYANYVRRESDKISFAFGQTYSYRLRGTYHRFSDNFDSAIIYLYAFRQEGIKHNIKMAEWLGTIDIGDVYMNIGQYEYAKSLYFMALSLTPSINPNSYNYSHLYNAIACSYQYLNILDSAEIYYREAIRYDLQVDDSVRMEERKSNLSETLMAMGKYSEAETYLMESYLFNKRRNLVDALGYNYCNLGKLFFLKNELDLSEKYFWLAHQESIKTTLKFKIADALNGLSEVQRRKGNFRKALEYKLRADSVEWKSATENKARQFSQLEERHKASKKEQENYTLFLDLEKESMKKRNLSIVIVALAVMVVAITLALYNYRKKKNLLSKQNDIISKQNERLAELNAEKNSLISYVSHDLGTPLVNIGLCTRSMEQKLHRAGLGDEYSNLIRNIKDSSDYGYELIQKILDVEAVESGFGKLEMSNVSLKSLIEEVANQFAETARAKQIELIIEATSANHYLFTDKKQLQRILENLLSNAFKFSKPGKRIWIKTSRDNNGISICVKDEGPGISEAEKEKLFLRYSRLGSQPTGNERSSGLGLYIVKRLADELKAQIQVQTARGAGSSFFIRFRN